MVAGPAALFVALLLLPGWVYWRFEASPRTARSALGELFEVVGAGAVATGATILAYVSVPDEVRGLKVGDGLIDPTDLSARFVQNHLTRVCWTVAALVAIACTLAALAARAQRWYRRHWANDRSTYAPEIPIWVRTLGDKDRVVTIDLRDGRRFTGYLGGHSVDDDGTPTVFLTPPLTLETPASRPVVGWAKQQPAVADFSGHAVTIPGPEIISVWREFSDDD